MAFELWLQSHCSKEKKGVLLPFEYLSEGTLDRENGCLVTAGKKRIGEGTRLANRLFPWGQGVNSLMGLHV